MTKFKFLISVIVIAGTVILEVQHQVQVQLRQENEWLRRQLEQLEMDNERLSNLVAQGNNTLPNEQFTELLKLRGEVGLLRQQTKELQTLREQNQQLQTVATSKNNSQNLQATNLPSKVTPLAIYPRASWAFAGYATPEATFQSLNWASAKGDLNALLDGSTPDMQKEFAKEFENKSESASADEIKNHINKNTQVSILSEDVRSDTEVVLTIVGDSEGNNSPDNLVFQKIDGQWKYAREAH